MKSRQERFVVCFSFKMVVNNESNGETRTTTAKQTVNSTNVKLITDNTRLLEETTLTIKEEIKRSFERLIDVLKSREKQLLRQVEAVHVQQLSLIQSDIELLNSKRLLNIDLSGTYDVESKILSLGKLEVIGKKGVTFEDTEPYKVQEYQDADKDHESFNKSIESDNKTNDCDIVVETFETTDKETSVINVSINSDESCGTFDQSNSICSYNSSFDSSFDNDNKSNLETNSLSVSNCTVIYKPTVSADDERSTKGKSTDSNGLSLDSTNENLNSDITADTEVETSEFDPEESYSINATTTTANNDSTDSNFHRDVNANKKQEENSSQFFNNASKSSGEIQRKDSGGEHPKQIQQWLQEILVETETEPMIHEIEQFSEISKARLSGQFPLET